MKRYGWAGDWFTDLDDGDYIEYQDFKDETAKLLEENKIMREALEDIKEGVEYDCKGRSCGTYSGTICSDIAEDALNKLKK
jgi:hypothetical protein